MKIIRDPVHEYITLSDNELRLVDSPWFQRLRHVRQNGPTRLVYPSSVGTRFEHSLGVMEIATQILKAALSPGNDGTKEVVEAFLRKARHDLRKYLGMSCRKHPEDTCQRLQEVLRFACLCHDLGHLPLSHTTERALDDVLQGTFLQVFFEGPALHELLSAEVVRHLSMGHRPLISKEHAKGVILILLGPPNKAISGFDFRRTVFHCLRQIVAGDYDADRFDYLLRDGYMSGAGFGRFDLERCVRSMRLCEERGVFEILPTYAATSAIEAALMERYKLYKWVCFHHKVLFFDQVAYEVARHIFEQPAFRRSFLIEASSKVQDAKKYLGSVVRALMNKDAAMPPLAVFGHSRAGKGKRDEMRRVDCGFLTRTENHFFADGWFCNRLRTLGREKKKWKPHFEALVDRQQCGVTIWKDYSAFQDFLEELLTQLDDCTQLRDAFCDTTLWTARRANWLHEVWSHIRVWPDFASRFSERLTGHLETLLRKAGVKNMRALFRIADWKLFGDVSKMRLIGRHGKPEHLSRSSYLLSRLSGLRGEVPFFAYLFGDAKSCAAALATLSGKRERLYKLSATAVKKTLLDLVCSKDEQEKDPLVSAWERVANASDDDLRRSSL